MQFNDSVSHLYHFEDIAASEKLLEHYVTVPYSILPERENHFAISGRMTDSSYLAIRVP